MSLFSTISSPLAGKANRGLLVMMPLLILSLAACLGLSDADKSYNSGVKLLDEGKFEEAIAEFDNAIVLDGSLAAAFHNRALAKESAGRLCDGCGASRNFTAFPFCNTS